LIGARHAGHQELRAQLAARIAAVALSLAVVMAMAMSAHAAQPDQSSSPPVAVHVYLTTPDLNNALARKPDLTLAIQANRPGGPEIEVDPRRRYQRFVGVGAAMTDTSAWLIHNQLSPAVRARLMDNLFGATGLRLNFLRVPIGASDFTARRTPYSYDDLPRGRTDPGLRHFSIARDLPYVIPTLGQAIRLNPGLFLMASLWSPPGWMKTNGALNNRNGSGLLLASALRPLASYLVRFLQAYTRQGIPIRALTPQNEPGNPTRYPGVNLTEPAEASFITRYLTPALRRAQLSTALYGFDWGWSRRSFAFARRLERDPAAAKLTGIASHCYFGSPTVMDALHRENPRLTQIESECSPGIVPYSTSELEIASLRNWASALALWNLAVDPSGGPVQPPNRGCPGCTGLVTIDERTHRVTPTLDLFQLGQLSKFVRPGAQRVASTHFVGYSYPGPNRNVASPGLDDVALRNPDGSTVLMVYDNSPRAAAFTVKEGPQRLRYALGPRATVTFTWR